MSRLVSIAVLALWGGCRGDAAITTPDPSAPDPSAPGTESEDSGSGADTAEPLDASWVADPDSPTFVTVTFAPRPGRAILSWSDASGAHETEVDALTGQVRLLGVPAGSQVTWTLRVGDEEHGPQTVSVPEAPVPLQEWVTEQHGTSEMVGQWTLTTQFHLERRSFAVIVDDMGRVRWWREAPPEHRILRIRPTDDGSGLVWASNIADRTGEDGRIVREFFDGTAAVTTVAPRLHHDFVEDDGGYAYLAWVDRDMALSPSGPVLPMTSDAIRRVAEGATGSSTEVFDFFDSWPGPVTQPCRHSSLLGSFVPGRIEWTHSNSLVRDPGGDGWWVLVRYLDQIGRVHADGTLSHILGGDAPTMPYEWPGLPMAHGHMSQVTDDGHLLVFSNGDHEHQGVGSYVIELDVDDEADLLRAVWATPEPEGRFVGYLGDARRLPGGNTLIVSPDHGLYEVTPDGERVWEAHHDPDRAFDTNLARAERIAPLPPY